MTKPQFLGGRAGYAALALALAASISGCSSDSSSLTAPDTTGQFSAVVAVGNQTTISGNAGLVSMPATRSDSTAPPASAILILQDKTTSAQVGFQWIGTSLPPAGSYSIGSDTQDVAVAFMDSAGTIFDGVSGNVTLASIANGHVSGTFSVTVQPSDGTTGNATISGNFNALVVVQ